MIDCLYTGQATDSQDCWWGEGRPLVFFRESARDALIQAIRIAKDMNFINPILFECDDHWNIPAKAPQSLQDRVPEKG